MNNSIRITLFSMFICIMLLANCNTTLKEGNTEGGIEEELNDTTEVQVLTNQQRINSILYGQLEQPDPYGPPEKGLLSSLTQVINNGGFPVERPKDYFTTEAWESNSLQYLTENSVNYQSPIPIPGAVKEYGSDLIRGFLFLDLLSSHNFGTKPAVLFFIARQVDGAWKFSHFGRLQIMEILNHEDGLPYVNDSLRVKGDIVITVD